MFALSDALAGGGIKENVWVIGRVLSLYKTIQFRVIWCSLTKDRVAKDWRVRSEVLKQTDESQCIAQHRLRTNRGCIFLDLAVLLSDRNHIGLHSSIKLVASICTAVNEVPK